jgi:Protein of unknown function (DUF3102)
MTILTTSQNRRHESTSRLQALEASADRLEIIAKDIERLQGTAIFEIAKRLAEARDLFRYCRDEGGFAGWVEARLRFSRQTAYNLLSVHERFGGESVKFLDTFPATILYLLAAPSTPEAARKEIIARAEKGEKVKVEAVKGAIRATRPAKKQTQPEKNTSPDCSQSGVSQVSTTPEKLTSGLPAGSDSSKNRVQQAEIAELEIQPNPIIAAWHASTLVQREEFIEDLGDFITEWSVTVKAREKDAELRYRIWQSCLGIDTGIDDADDESGHWHAEYESLADQLSELEQTINDAEEEETGNQTTDDGLDIPDYLKRVAP